MTYYIPKNTRETDNLLYIRDNCLKILITGLYQLKKEIDGVLVVYWLVGKRNKVIHLFFLGSTEKYDKVLIQYRT